MSSMHKLLLRHILHVLFWFVQLLKWAERNVVLREMQQMARTAKIAISYLQLDLR